MARTIHGNLTGRAAQTQRLDDMLDMPTPVQDCGNAMATLKQIDPLGWEGWYDANVTDGGPSHIARQVWERVEYLNGFIQYCAATDTRDPRTPAQVDADFQDADYAATIAAI